MPEIASGIRLRDRVARGRWLRLIPPIVLLLAVAGCYLAAITFRAWRADLRYRQAAAEADRADPGWRLDDLLAKLEVIPDAINSAVKLQSLARRLPTGWPGDLAYDHSFLDPGRPDRGFDAARLDRLRQVLGPAAGFVPEARALADYPRGQFRGPRPGVERLEPVGGLNALRDVGFPFGDDVRRVVVLLWIDAMDSLERGNLEAALVDARAMINAGRSVGDHPGLSAQSARMGATMMALAVIERVLARGEVRDESLASLRSLLEDEERRPLAMVALRGERAVVDDLLQDIRSGRADVGAIPQFFEHDWIDRAFVGQSDLRDNQTDLLRYHTRAVEIGKMPEGDRIAAMKAHGEGWTQEARGWNLIQRAGKLAERRLLGRTVGIPLWFGGGKAALWVGLAGLAAERFRLARGRWPDSPEALVPGWLATIPADPLATRGPIKFRRFPDGLFFYSNGYDGVDDGGKIRWDFRMVDGADFGFRLWDAPRSRPSSPDPSTVDED